MPWRYPPVDKLSFSQSSIAETLSNPEQTNADTTERHASKQTECLPSSQTNLRGLELLNSAFEERFRTQSHCNQYMPMLPSLENHNVGRLFISPVSGGRSKLRGCGGVTRPGAPASKTVNIVPDVSSTQGPGVPDLLERFILELGLFTCPCLLPSHDLCIASSCGRNRMADLGARRRWVELCTNFLFQPN